MENTYMSFRMIVSGLALTFAPVMAHEAQAQIAGFQPHRAIYGIDLDRTQERSSILDADGRLVIETGGNACDGYTVSQRLVVRFDREDGVPQTLDFRISTFEAGDGSIYRFVTRTYLDDTVVEDVTGKATRREGRIAVELKNPDGKTITLPTGTLFPTQHLTEILEAAQSDERFMVREVYEGSEKGETIDTATAVIGRTQVSSDAEPVTGGVKRWPVTISYFNDADDDETAGEETPNFQTSFLLYENGVTRSLKLDYGEFTLLGDLADIEYLPKDECTDEDAT